MVEDWFGHWYADSSTSTSTGLRPEYEHDCCDAVPVMEAGVTPILVTGDPDRNKVQTMPCGSPVTMAIKLPANWDTLMADLGYRPLNEFFLD